MGRETQPTIYERIHIDGQKAQENVFLLLIIQEMKIKLTIVYHLKQVIMAYYKWFFITTGLTKMS